MSQEDAVNIEPAVHRSDGVAGVNCAERQNGPRLNGDHIITSRSKTTLRKGFRGVAERTWAPSSQLEAVSHLSETRHTHPSDV